MTFAFLALLLIDAAYLGRRSRDTIKIGVLKPKFEFSGTLLGDVRITSIYLLMAI
jgi:hypothetical protein